MTSVDLTDFDGHVFDMDGVVTDTAGLHERAWKVTFDELLRAERGGDAEQFTEEDYVEHVDGKPRYDGVAAFLDSRGVDLSYGEPSDPPDAATVCGVGNRKNRRFLELLHDEGPTRFESTVRLVEELRARGRRTAVISSSRNAHEVLRRAGIHQLFDTAVTGVEAAELELAGKPAPDIFTEAARRLGVEPERAVVVEDARAGVQAGRRGGFGLVVGVDRRGTGELADHGADVVVSDLGELLPLPVDDLPAIRDLPDAIDRLGGIVADDLVVLLDYDGTLTPIVEDPTAADLPAETRDALARLAEVLPLAVISGRDLDDVQERVAVEGIAYAGSHGFDIELPDGTRHEVTDEHLDDLDAAEASLRDRVGDVPGARVERKRHAIAVHDRQVDDDHRDEVARAAEEIAGAHDRLRLTSGKRVHELRPDVPWDKGRALTTLLDELQLRDRTPLYVGDDVTDEDGFRAARARGGYAVVVRGEDDDLGTLAEASLQDPIAVRTFLDRLARKAGA